MQCYIKTERGIAEIAQRQFALNPKQRRVLLLIDSPAFLQLEPSQQQRWVCEQTLTELQALQLITLKTDASVKARAISRQNLKPTAKTAHQHSAKAAAPSSPQSSRQSATTKMSMRHNASATHEQEASLWPNKEKTAPRAVPQAVEFKILSFTQIQTFMIDSLQQFCGLMAKPLIELITQARTIAQLKQCQIQWLTHLQESRMSAVQLSFSCQQLNFAMNAL